MEPGVKSSRLIGNSEIAIDILDLAAQSSEVMRDRRVIADSIVRAKVVTEGCFDERGFCGTGIFGRFCQPRGHAFGEINANSGFHGGSRLNATQGRHRWCKRTTLALAIS
jgi:hypothetical protein